MKKQALVVVLAFRWNRPNKLKSSHFSLWPKTRIEGVSAKPLIAGG